MVRPLLAFCSAIAGIEQSVEMALHHSKTALVTADSESRRTRGGKIDMMRASFLSASLPADVPHRRVECDRFTAGSDLAARMPQERAP
jgi:hypothetical protein